MKNKDLVLKRFWAKVDKKEDGCWEWTAHLVGGYGKFRVDGKLVQAHRLSYEIAKGPIPAGYDVRHSCHNRPCVNPDHLSVGTRADNMRDKMEAGRHYVGEVDREIHAELMRRAWAAHSPEERQERVDAVSEALAGKPFTDEHLANLRASPANQKGRAPRAFGAQLPRTALNADQVLEIRGKYAIGMKTEELGKEYGINHSAISGIVRGLTYKWVATEPVKRLAGYGTKTRSEVSTHANLGRVYAKKPKPEKIKQHDRRQRLTDDQVAELRQLYADGMAQSKLAAQFSVSQGLVNFLVTGQRRAEAGGPITLGRYGSAEWKEKIAMSNTGKAHTDETREKMRQAKLAKRKEQHTNV